MKPDEIPSELVHMLDEAAGKIHRDGGSALRSLAEILTRYEELRPGNLAIGDIVHGHVSGVFGRDHYDCARVEAIGSDWVVVRHLGNRHEMCFANGDDVLSECAKARKADEWADHSFACPANS